MIFGLAPHLRSREGLAAWQNRAWLVMKSASSRTPIMSICKAGTILRRISPRRMRTHLIRLPQTPPLFEPQRLKVCAARPL